MLLCLVALASLGVVMGDTPSQVHLGVSDNASKVPVSWATEDACNTTVQWGSSPTALSNTAVGTSNTYSVLFYKSPYLHNAVMTGLEPATTVYYRVGDASRGFSPVLNFTTAQLASSFPQRFFLIADHGHTTDESVVTTSRMVSSLNANPFDALILAGDLSYADGAGKTWDLYMNQIQPLASRVPFLTTVGNHEMVIVDGVVLPNLKSYTNRFLMPSPSPLPSPLPERTLFWSANVGSLHTIALNSENITDFGPGTPMYEWLDTDLTAANANRAAVPWIMCFWHRPIYSSDHTHGNDTTMRDQLEPLLLKHRVNFVHSGHVHAYERSNPMANGVVAPPGTHGIVYFTNGMAGNGEGLYKSFVDPRPPMSAFRLADYGHSQLTVHNATHLQFQLILNSNGTVADDSWLTQPAP